MTRLNAVADRVSGQAFGLANYGNLEADVNYLIGSATVASATTLAITTEASVVTGTTTIDNISDALGAATGQQVRLFFQSPLTIRHNGGGTGNIRTLSGTDRQVFPNEVVAFVYDGTVWREAGSARPARKTTATAVNTTVTETDLLGGAFTLPANIVGLNGRLLFRAWGDYLQNGGAPTVLPRLKFKLGATVIFDTGAGGTFTTLTASATRYGWEVEVEMLEIAATNLQSARYRHLLSFPGGTGFPNGAAFTTGEGARLPQAGGAGSTPALEPAEAQNAAAVDTTVANAIVLSVILGASNAALEMKCTGAEWEVA